jgi:uncharacterized protein YjiS (DUF1127 family)
MLSGNTTMSDLMMTRFDQARQSAERVRERHLLRSLRLTLRTALTRRTLMELTPRELADIGISASTALTEAARLPWDISPGPRPRIAGIVGGIQRALERARTRRLISRLEARELRELGISPSDAQVEATKFFWQV